MNKLKMQTPNKVDENVERIATLFPNCVTESIGKDGKPTWVVDFDLLRQELSGFAVEGQEERYQFTWADKKKSILLANSPISKTLRPCREESVDFDTTKNLYIEGDNLDVLKLFQETYMGKVKMIYIDPPYNTGNDFVYEDDFAISAKEYFERSGASDDDGNRLFQNNDSNGRFHTDWLNMIYPRLKLARDLLADDGVILVNIDEHEIVNLTKICAEVFGAFNELGVIIWDKRNPKGDAKGISYQHEYIVCFTKNKWTFLESCKMLKQKKNAETMLNKAAQIFKKANLTFSLDDANKEFAEWILGQNFSGGEKAYNRMDDKGDLYQAVSMAWPNNKKAPDDYFIPLIHPITKKPCPVPPKGWRNPSATMRDLQSTNSIIFGNDETTQPRRKYLLKDNMYENITSLLYYGGSDTDLLADLQIPFDTPKVVNIVKEHISSFTKKTDIILDFFSGSATTAHAVMQLNAEDGGNRKYIMVQLPEETDEKSEAYKSGYKNICEIGKERIRRAGKKILDTVKENKQIDLIALTENIKGKGLFETTENLKAKSIIDIGFRVLKVDSSNMKPVFYNPEAVEQSLISQFEDNIKDDRTPEDLLFQVMLDMGVDLSSPITVETLGGKKVFTVGGDNLICCFDKDITKDAVTSIAKAKPLYAVFRDSSFARDDVMVSFDQIFATYSPTTERSVI
ncbi:MAG: site-specific DNA-methyltransferase [Christensenellaceae bacterium]|jgi:adenine-specific DNA-methyltransferase|nr:site-specific DNA-methyltransferase [Christensenellaceae bacterium]